MDTANTGTYTKYMEQNLVEMAEEEAFNSECDYSMLLEKINSNSFFESFPERFLRYVSKREGKDYSPRDAYLFLLNKMEAAGINANRNTLKKWFNVGEAPEGVFLKMGDDSREAMFQVAFALGFSVKETEDFFRRVYLDKAFNIRNPKEFIYNYCLLRGKTYSDASNLVAEAERILSSGSDSNKEANTVLLKNKAQDAVDDKELLTYIGEHAFSFTKDNKTAHAQVERLLRDLKGDDSKEGLAQKEYRAFKEDNLGKTDGRNVHSVDFVLDMAINGAGMINKSVGGTGAEKVKELLPRKEISNQFPNKTTISRFDSSYILRKNIIFLYFYWFWVKVYLKDYGYTGLDYDSFVEELNNTLETCGYGPLYFGNPYDWLFLYCANCSLNEENPLDVFRGIMEDNEDDEI